jgi:hypothetical protein
MGAGEKGLLRDLDSVLAAAPGEEGGA